MTATTATRTIAGTAAGRGRQRGDRSLLPRVHSPLRALAISMTVMCYLACLAIGGMVLIHQAVNAWTSDIASEVTVQITPVEDEDIEANVAAAVKILEATPGVTTVKALDKQAGEKLLEPWIGKTSVLEELPIPRLIAVTIDTDNPPDFKQLQKRLEDEIVAVSLDTHQRWQAELTRMAATLKWLGAGILVLIVGSAVALVIYASEAALVANRDVVEVLHLCGATDSFIASQVQRRFLAAGLQAGLLGAAAGLLTFGALALGSGATAPTGLAEASRSLIFAPPDVAFANFTLFLLVPVTATLICLVAARYAILRILKQVY